ncbi:MAG: hypothetical protein JSR86_11480 [Proteobacteria bacterium]|nr:hypothetical protein [Pseudomonadota bacterium]
MRPVGIGLAIALIAAVMAPAAAFAAKPPAAPAVSKENRERGMKDAAAVVAASGMDCQVADARFIGEGADPKTKKKTSYYELACTGGEGLVVAKSDVTVTYTCLETAVGPDGKPSNLSCILPANADPNAGLAPYLVKGGVTNCDVANGRALGRSDKSVVFEAACKNGDGYIIIAGNPPKADAAVEVNPCLGYDEGSSMACKLTDRAALLSVVDRLAPSIGKPCTVTNRGYIGVTQQKHENLYEVACKEGKGYILVQKADGTLDSAIDCGATDMCKMTDARQAQTEQAGLYTKLARKAGFECDVDRYFPFPARGGIDAVELTCKNRQDGGVGVFTGSTGQVFDCAHAEIEGYRCSNTKPELTYPTLTADLKKLNKPSCVVSSARTVGVTAEKHGYIEVGCADGLPGFMIEYSVTPLAPLNVLGCAQATGIAGGCKLPGNTKKS